MPENERKNVVTTHHSEPVVIQAMRLEGNREQKDRNGNIKVAGGTYIEHVRLYTDKGEITFKPKVQAETTSQLAGMDFTIPTTEKFGADKVLVEFPFLDELMHLIKKKPGQKAIITYKDMATQTFAGEDVTYHFMDDAAFRHIHIASLDKDKKNLAWMQEEKMKADKKAAEKVNASMPSAMKRGEDAPEDEEQDEEPLDPDSP